MTNLASVLLNRGERGETPGILNLRDRSPRVRHGSCPVTARFSGNSHRKCTIVAAGGSCIARWSRYWGREYLKMIKIAVKGVPWYRVRLRFRISLMSFISMPEDLKHSPRDWEKFLWKFLKRAFWRFPRSWNPRGSSRTLCLTPSSMLLRSEKRTETAWSISYTIIPYIVQSLISSYQLFIKNQSERFSP